MSDFKNIDGPEWLDYASREMRKLNPPDRGTNVVLLMFSLPATLFLTILAVMAIAARSAARGDDKVFMREGLLLMGVTPFVVIFGFLSLFVLARRGGGFAWWYNAIVNVGAMLLLAVCVVLMVVAAR